MHRIATALLIVAAVLAVNAGMLREAFARDAAPLPVAARPALAGPPLLALEAVRPAPGLRDRQKV